MNEKLFHAGDVVKHGPTGETWVLANDQDGEHVSPCGWPCSLAYASDCVLIERATEERRLAKLHSFAATYLDERDGEDHRVSTAKHQLAKLNERKTT